MILKSDAVENKDYTIDWPSHYFEIPGGQMKLAILQERAAAKLNTPEDDLRLKLCNMRYEFPKKGGCIDKFMRAWTLMVGDNAMGINFFTMKKQEKELMSYKKDFMLDRYEELQSDPASKEAGTPQSMELLLILEEWKDFAATLITSCAGSKAYCSTFLGLIPMKNRAVGEKIAREFTAVLITYPGIFKTDCFTPLYEVVKTTFCQIVEDGPTYF